MSVRMTRDQTVGEEIANSITHGIGSALAVVALVLLVVSSVLHGDVWHVISSSIFGVGLVLMYANSTIYHSLGHEKAKKVFKVLDHSTIYFLIAATYTPFTLTVLRGPWGWTLFGIVWAGFILGTIFKVFFAGRYGWLSVVIYIVLGWSVLIAIVPLFRSLPLSGILLLFAGGVAYSMGTAVYAKKGVRYSHAVWHLYVMAGSLFHFLSVYFYVIPQ